MGGPVNAPFPIVNDSAMPKSYELTWSVVDSEGASDTAVVSLGSLPPGESLTRTVEVPASSTTVESVPVTPLVHEGMRTYHVVMSADLDGDGEPEPVSSTALRTMPPAPEQMPGRALAVAPGRLTFTAKAAAGQTFALPDASNDPSIEGEALEIFDTGGSGSLTFALPAAGWKGLGRPAGAKGWHYRGDGSLADPCKSVVVKGNGVKASCKGAAVSATLPAIGEAGIILSLGSDTQRYCASFGGTVVRNDALLLKRKNAAAPGRCPVPNP